MTINKVTLKKSYPIIIIIAGLIGLTASFILTLDKINVLENPSYHLNCNLNPVLSCGDVLQAKQGVAFGFPNPFLGLAAFSVLVTVGVSILAGAKFKRWFWIGLELGSIFGIGFIAWLFYQTLYRIHAVCPYCATVWIAVITTFWYTTLYNIDNKNLVISNRFLPAYNWIRKHHLDLLILIFLLLTALVLKHFWYFYGKYF
jgi:uncharacterized membrane protein